MTEGNPPTRALETQGRQHQERPGGRTWHLRGTERHQCGHRVTETGQPQDGGRRFEAGPARARLRYVLGQQLPQGTCAWGAHAVCLPEQTVRLDEKRVNASVSAAEPNVHRRKQRPIASVRTDGRSAC